MFTREFFNGLVGRANRINVSYHEIGGEWLYQGSPRVEILLHGGSKYVARYRDPGEPDDDALHVVVYDEQGGRDRIAFIPYESIARVEVLEPSSGAGEFGFSPRSEPKPE